MSTAIDPGDQSRCSSIGIDEIMQVYEDFSIAIALRVELTR